MLKSARARKDRMQNLHKSGGAGRGELMSELIYGSNWFGIEAHLDELMEDPEADESSRENLELWISDLEKELGEVQD